MLKKFILQLSMRSQGEKKMSKLYGAVIHLLLLWKANEVAAQTGK
jgi:hypothetical protein